MEEEAAAAGRLDALTRRHEADDEGSLAEAREREVRGAFTLYGRVRSLDHEYSNFKHYFEVDRSLSFTRAALGGKEVALVGNVLTITRAPVRGGDAARKDRDIVDEKALESFHVGFRHSQDALVQAMTGEKRAFDDALRRRAARRWRRVRWMMTAGLSAAAGAALYFLKNP